MRRFPLDGALLLFDRRTGLSAICDGQETAKLRMRAPRVVQFAITNACNLACTFCSRDVDARSQWTPETALGFLRELDEAGCLEVAFGGGEPLAFNVFRLSDITQLESPAPHADFKAKVLRLRKERLSIAPKLDLSSWRTVVTSASRRFPLITLHTERRDADVCYIGRPTTLTARSGTFLSINPDGEWDDELAVAWADVTRVDFGGAYEEALALVGYKTER